MKRKILASEICKIVGAKIRGNDCEVNSLAKVGMDSQYNNLLTYCTSKNYLNLIIVNDNFKAVFISPILHKKFEKDLKAVNTTFLLTDNPQESFYYIHTHLFAKTNFYNDFDFAREIGKNPDIHKSAIIEGGVIIGSNVKIGPNVVIHSGTIIGDNVVIEANTTLGIDGFQVANIDNKRILVPHTGGVLVENDSRIGSNVVICRSLFDGRTKIGKECQIDSLVNISHNVEIGSKTNIVSGTCINGRVKIGENVYIASGVTILNGILIGKNASINMGSVVAKSVDPNQTVAGFYAMPNSLWLKRMRE